MASKRFLINVFSVAAGLVAASISARALAETCSAPGYVEWRTYNKELGFWCNSNYYTASVGDCNNNTMTSIKLYLSLLESAILSQKHIEVVAASGCYNVIVWLQVDQ